MPRPLFGSSVRFGASSGYYGKVLNPVQIKAQLDQDVIGQEAAKKAVSVAAYDHLKRIGYQVSAAEIRETLAELVTLQGTDEENEAFVRDITKLVRENALDNPNLSYIISASLYQAHADRVIEPVNPEKPTPAVAPKTLTAPKAAPVVQPVQTSKLTRREQQQKAMLQAAMFGSPPIVVGNFGAGIVDVAAPDTQNSTTVAGDSQSTLPDATAAAETIVSSPPVSHATQAVGGQYVALGDALTEALRKIQDRKEMDAVSDRLNTVQIDKKNILLIGPTGVGKTQIARALGRVLELPYCIESASDITSAGYVGRKASDIPRSLVMAADGDVEKAGRGIAFVDEVDKIRRTNCAGSERDVGGKGAQDSLLRIMEDATVEVELGEKPNQTTKIVDMRNVLFVFAGAFVGLEDIVAERLLPKKSSIGFTNQQQDLSVDKLTPRQKRALLKYVTPQDLVAFGMTPEFVGRIPVVVTLEQMTADMLKRILTEPRNALEKQYTKLLEMDGVTLKFDDEAYTALAEYAIAQDTGARGLQAMLEKVTQEIRFEAANLEGPDTYTITGQQVRQILHNAFGNREQIEQELRQMANTAE